MSAAGAVCSETGFINACLGAREWENKEGYVNNDLFLPKMNKEGVPLEALETENSKMLTFDKTNTQHFRPLMKKESTAAASFEPAKAKGDDFDL